jgi:hypothetical protein
MSAQPYITQKQHLDHPPGSSCMAERVGGTIFLEFGGEETVALDGRRFYLKGLEPEPEKGLKQLMDEEIMQYLGKP